jgi:hypothetical protein
LEFYGFADVKSLLATPLATFWMLHRNIDRLMAEKDIRVADVAIRSQSSDGVRALLTDLRTQMGTVVDFDEVLSRQEEKLDRAGLNGLRGIGKAFS